MTWDILDIKLGGTHFAPQKGSRAPQKGSDIQVLMKKYHFTTWKNALNGMYILYISESLKYQSYWVNIEVHSYGGQFPKKFMKIFQPRISTTWKNISKSGS